MTGYGTDPAQSPQQVYAVAPRKKVEGGITQKLSGLRQSAAEGDSDFRALEGQPDALSQGVVVLYDEDLLHSTHSRMRFSI